MIASLNSDCSILTLTADALIAEDGKTIDSLVLKSRLNCSLTESEVDISSLIEEITDSQISIPATTFYNNEDSIVYCDGVFYFKLEITYTNETDTYLVEDSACTIIDCELKCKVLDYYTSTKDKKAWYYYYALLQSNDCDTCYCTETCSLYTELKLLINDNSIPSTTSGCGCT